MNEMEQNVSAVLKNWSETVLASGGSSFYMSQLIEYVQAAVPGSAPDTITAVLGQMKGQGEVNIVAVQASEGLYSIGRPGQAQTTMFGAPSDPQNNGEKKKKKPFTKKQKQAAFDELNAMGELGPGLTRLYEWLYEQLM